MKPLKPHARGISLPLCVGADELKDEVYANTPSCCYFCERDLFFFFFASGERKGSPWAADGANIYELDDQRPDALVVAALAERTRREITASPEYENCKRVAAEHSVPVRLVYESAAAHPRTEKFNDI